jgi:hypothetical protein
MRIEFRSHKDTKALGWDSMIKIRNAKEGLSRIQTFTVWDKTSPQLNFNCLNFRYLNLSGVISNNKHT